MTIHLGLSYDPPVSDRVQRSWQAELDRVRLGNTRLSWLLLHWMPGEDWAPVERWFLYDMVPATVLYQAAEWKARQGYAESENFEATLLQQLNDFSPRDPRNPRCGYYDDVLKQFVRHEDNLLDLTQWTLWQRHHAYAVPFWVVQGKRGGHLWRFSDAEARELRYLNLPDRAPAPGSLPYAPCDQRVWRQVLRYDRLKRAEEALGRRLGAEANQKAEAEKVRGLRTQYLTMLEDQFRDALPMGMNGAASDMLAEREDRFINRGLTAA